MPRVLTLAQSALAAPFAGSGDLEIFATFEAKPPIHCSRIVRYRALPDGNKRTAYDVMIGFVERNGRTWQHGAGSLAMVERIAGEAPPLNVEEFRRLSSLPHLLNREAVPVAPLEARRSGASRWGSWART
jgi:hypothetical protein